MADKRIIEVTPELQTLLNGYYVLLDSQTSGTAKYNLYTLAQQIQNDHLTCTDDGDGNITLTLGST